jgi:hypothetical protein
VYFVAIYVNLKDSVFLCINMGDKVFGTS